MREEFIPQSLDIEKYCLSLMIRHPEILPDVLPLVDSNDFYSHGNCHETIFEVIRATFAEKNTVDKVLIIDRVRNIGLKFAQGIDIADYVDAITSINKISVDKWIYYFQELKKYSIARKINQGAIDVQKIIKKNINEPASVLISKAEQTFIDCVTTYIEDDYKPESLHSGLRDYIEGLGNEPREDGIIPPLPIYYRKYGGFTPGDLTVIAAPDGAGKSTFLNDVAIGAAHDPRNRCKVLILDTELETSRARTRRVAALSGVNEYFIRTGKWRMNEEMTKKVRNVLDQVDKLEDRVHHLYVANKPIDQIQSIIRRWVAHEIKEDEDPLIVYDYLKLTGESVTESWKEYQVMGKKTDTLKHLCSELGAACLAAVQTNAEGNVAMARQIRWFASNIFILMPKTPEELADHGSRWGTHKLIRSKTRNQGAEADGFSTLVPIVNSDGKTELVENYICLEFKNFKVKELGTLEQLSAQHAGHMAPSHNLSDDDDLL